MPVHTVNRRLVAASLAKHRVVVLASLNVLACLVLATLEFGWPNAPRWTRLPTESPDYLPPSLLRSSDSFDSIPAYLFGYSRLLVMVFAIVTMWCAASVGLHRNARRLEASLVNGDERNVEKARTRLRLLEWLRDAVAEPLLGGFVLTLGAWIAVSALVAKADVEWFRHLIPAPWQVARQLQTHAAPFADAMVKSGTHLSAAIVAGSLIGIAAGYLLSRSPLLHRSTAFHVTVVAGLPPILLAELFAKIAGLKPVQLVMNEEISANRIGILMATWAITWPTVTATTLSLRSIEPEFRRSIQMLGARHWWEWLWHVELPVIRPAVFSNLRVGVAIGLIVLLYGEGRGGSPDHKTLGVWLSEIGAEFPIPQLFALLVFTSGVFIVLELFLRLAELLATSRKRVTGAAAIHKQSALSDTYDRRKALEQFETARAQWLAKTGGGFVSRGLRPILEIGSVRRTYSGHVAFGHLRSKGLLTVEGGTITSVIGRSGAGKSTFLKLALGFERADDDAREISIGDPPLPLDEGGGTWCLDHVCYVSQRTTLLPNKTVLENLMFGIRQTLRTEGITGDEIQQRNFLVWLLGHQSAEEIGRSTWKRIAPTSPLAQLTEFFGLTDKLHRRPAELSGGEAQRVHLLRWLLMPRPVLVMDEAFSALDQPLKGMLRDAIMRHAEELRIAVINVSHDRADVLQISNRILFINRGEVQAEGAPSQLYRNPPSRDLAIFLGHTNLFTLGTVTDRREIRVSRDEYRGTDLNDARIPVDHVPAYETNKKVFIPITAVRLVDTADEVEGEQFEIDTIRFLGTHYEARLNRPVPSPDGAMLRLDIILKDEDYERIAAANDGAVRGQMVFVAPTQIVEIKETAP